MGEKLLAQRVLTLLRGTSGRNSKAAQAALEWAADQREWLWPETIWAEPAGDEEGEAKLGETLDWDSLPRLAGAIEVAEPDPGLFGCVEAVSALLELGVFEKAVLGVSAALERLPRLASLRSRLIRISEDLPALVGCLAGAPLSEAATRVRRCGPVTLGLLELSSEGGDLILSLHWSFGRLLDQGLTEEERLIDALAGIRQEALLSPEDFAERRSDLGLLTRLLAGAVARKAEGVNVLIYGPPGTGKTEFARTLAASVGARLFSVGECDEDGEEPTRWERLQALTRAQRLLARRGDSLLLFDEMEDLFAEASRAAVGSGRRAGSKIFVNRMLEANKVPTIWTSNAIGGIDQAHLRRMSFVLRMDHPSPEARARIAARVAETEGAEAALAGLDALVRQEAEAGSVARVALRAAALAGGSAADAEAVGISLVLGLRGGRALAPSRGSRALDLDLYEADRPIAPLIARLSEAGTARDYSLLLTGPPGTGKTALAAHLAERLDRPLTVKRASDLFSKWVGGTEANIAEAFADARDRGSVLLFDEVDSLLLDRAEARHSWEITQVNELLTWMDSHPLPFVAATNFARRLDPAALRRFVFKIELQALSPRKAEQAFARFFGRSAPPGLAQIGGLTPGDFAVVARQLRFAPDADRATILSLLEAEARAKPEAAGRIGF